MKKLQQKTSLSRREEFARLRDQGKTLKEIGDTQNPSITAERVRQILNPVPSQSCEKHRIRYYGLYCEYCVVEKNYPKVVSALIKEGPKALEAEFERLSQPDRSKTVVIQRAFLVKALKDRMRYSISDISKLLSRDYGAIKNLYYKKI